jgi:hypothetical protein
MLVTLRFLKVRRTTKRILKSTRYVNTRNALVCGRRALVGSAELARLTEAAPHPDVEGGHTTGQVRAIEPSGVRCVDVYDTCRAGNRRFWLLRGLCPHTKVPYKIDSLWETLRPLKRPGRAQAEDGHLRDLHRRDEGGAARGEPAVSWPAAAMSARPAFPRRKRSHRGLQMR